MGGGKSHVIVKDFLMKGQICGLPYYIKKKGNTGMRTRILMSFKKFNDSQKDSPCAMNHTWKKTVTNDRARIKHVTLKFRGPVGLGGMIKWWKNEFLKEHWPKSWMCSSHVVMVCYCCWNCQEESVKKRGRGSDTQPFILPGEVIRAEWHQSFSLDEIYKIETPTAK